MRSVFFASIFGRGTAASRVAGRSRQDREASRSHCNNALQQIAALAMFGVPSEHGQYDEETDDSGEVTKGHLQRVVVKPRDAEERQRERG